MRWALFFTLFACGTVGAQDSLAVNEWEAYWHNLNNEFADSLHSPLAPAARDTFQTLQTFPYNPSLRIMARYTATKKPKTFEMKTSTDRAPVYRKVGKLEFEVNGITEELFVYQNVQLSATPAFKNYLFIPFTDLTNFEETYGGGRYIDVESPIGTSFVLDFNKAYNPYCAYNTKYSCPIPPLENHLGTRITAGVLVFTKDNGH